jgi:transcriptional regulator with XRE-family HTH domain
MAVKENKSRKLTPLQLHRKVGLLRVGITQSEIARQTGFERATVSLVMLDHMRNEKIEAAIASAIGEPVELIFPPKVKVENRSAA